MYRRSHVVLKQIKSFHFDNLFAADVNLFACCLLIVSKVNYHSFAMPQKAFTRDLLLPALPISHVILIFLWKHNSDVTAPTQ